MKDTNIYQKIYELVNEIPCGMVSTYGAIAQKIGMQSSARMVGYALSADKHNFIAPYHRVVNRNGDLTGKNAFPGDTMRKLLESEGIEFVGNRVNMKKHFWRP
ncbi:MAG TPA: MGMT family protein [Candidatus Kapabacteria bacterium]|nr:MGMT family protein [Candidatus Kapabacteria bacterium]